jgi:hypothetical protein
VRTTKRRKTARRIHHGENMNLTYLLHKTIRLELVAVRQAAHERAFTDAVAACSSTLRLRSSEGAICCVVVLARCLIRLDPVRVWVSSRPLTMSLGLLSVSTSHRCRSLQLVVRLPMPCSSLIRLTVQQKIAQYPTRAPEETVRPALDPTLVLVEHEYGAGADHFALGVDETAGDPRDDPATGGFEHDEGVAGGSDPAGPGRFGPRHRRWAMVGGDGGSCDGRRL